MLATSTIFNRRDVLLSTDTSTLAPAANPPFVRLAMNAFVPTSEIAVGDITPATFDGYADIAAPTGAQLQSQDPLTQDSIVQMKPPAGGWRWETTGLTNLPMTIFGYALIDDAETVVYGSELFPEPIVLNGVNQSITIGSVQFATPPNTMQ